MPPSRFRVRYPVEAFDGGLNNKYEPTIITDTESPDALNVVFDDLGSVGTRGGYSQLNTTAVGSFSGDGLYTTRFDDASETMCAWWDGTMHTLAATTFTTVASSESVFTAGTRVDMKMYQDIAFFGNGNTPYKYNGTEFTRHGIPAPNSIPTGSTLGTAGNPNGDYLYKVSYVNSYVVEGDVSTLTGTITASNEIITLTSIPVAPASFGVNARKIYRTVDDGSTFKLVATIEDNTTTTYSDDVADGSLGADAPLDNAEPPNWKYVAVHGERLWFIDPTNPGFVYYTELGNPFVVKTTNFIKLGDGDGEQGVALGAHADSVMFYKTGSVWAIYTGGDSTPGNWSAVRTQAKYGAGSHYAIADYSNLQMFLGRRFNVLSGFYALAGLATVADRIDLTVTGIFADSQSDRIEPDVFMFNEAAMHLSCAIEYKNKLWFAVPYGISQLTNNRVYQFDFQRRDKDRKRGSWIPFDGINAADFTVYDGKLYFQDVTANGLVHQLNDGTYTDNGAAINSYFWTKEYGGKPEHRDLTKDFRFGKMTIETLGAWFMGFTYRTNADSGSGNSTRVNLDPGGSLWGSMVWGIDTWGGGNTRKDVTVYFPGASAETIQFKFDNENTAAQGFKVLRLPFFYNVRGLR